MILDILSDILKNILNELNYEVDAKVIKSNRPDLCDYQFDGVFKLASIYHKSPIEIGEEIVNRINELDSFNDYFKEVTFVKPGFVNIKISDKLINKILIKMNDNPKFNIEQHNDELFFMDYGGYNIAKPLHIGHLRPSIVGESIKRLIEFKGYKTISDVHLGDFGLQMGQVIYGIKRDNLNVEDITIDYLNKIYPEISKLCKENEEIKEECGQITKDLQDGVNEEYTEYWKKIMEVSLDDVKELCDYLGITFDMWCGESDAYKYLDKAEALLNEKGLLKQSEGATIIEVGRETDKKEMPPLIFKNSKGAYLYPATDIATIIERSEKYNPDHIIYVTDFRQNLHFEQVFRSCDLAGIINYDSLEHDYNGTINGSDGKPYKTRQGGTPKLRDLISNVKETFISKKEENKDMNKEDIDKIVNAIIKFADLQNNREKDYIFDIDKFSDVVGKTGPYILYTYLRINKIIENKETTTLNDIVYNDYDRNLRLKILELELSVNEAFKYRMPSYIADYVYDLCVTVNSFYQNNHVNNEEDVIKKNNYIYVLSLTNKIIKEMLNILAIDIPSVM